MRCIAKTVTVAFGLMLALSAPARAETKAEQRAQLQGTYLLLISFDICGFYQPTDEQTGALRAIAHNLQKSLEMSSDDARAYCAKLEGVVRQDMAERGGRCDERGPWSQLYEPHEPWSSLE